MKEINTNKTNLLKSEVKEVLEINIGNPSPLGSSITDNGVNFSVIASNAEFIELLIFDSKNAVNPYIIFKLDSSHCSGPYWHAEIKGLKKGALYGFRVHQKYNCDSNYSKKILLDPCSREITGWDIYNRENACHQESNLNTCLKSIVCERDKFDFDNFPRPKHSWEETIIYELHINAFTKNVKNVETDSQESSFKKLIRKIPYLKDLGVTTIELLPIFCFDPNDAPNGLQNYWGYSPINWFSPHFQYFTNSSSEGSRKEFRKFVEACHYHNIEVILDVVYNHTSEGNKDGPILSWKGFDESLFYFIDKKKNFQDVTGCGNTIAANRGLVRRLIIESLKCWANELGVDGFRFDLGIALSRGENLIPLLNPPFFEDLESDPELTEVKFISEPWDCGGLYRSKDFPAKNVFTWNGYFRDDSRKFWKGEDDTAWNLSSKLQISPNTYEGKNTYPKSINFITAHDGFTLKDLVSFNNKYNFSNREQNKDGENHNNSWNHGVEGPSNDLGINSLRKKQQRNLLFTLLISRGVPMLLMGDEVGRSQGGNNNTWCQDNSLAWMNWNEKDQDLELLAFVKKLICIRKKLSKFINPMNKSSRENLPEIYWHGTTINNPDWSSWSHTLAFSINKSSPILWCGLNAYKKNINFCLPKSTSKWLKIIDTADSNITEPKQISGNSVDLESRSAILLISKKIYETSIKND